MCSFTDTLCNLLPIKTSLIYAVQRFSVLGRGCTAAVHDGMLLVFDLSVRMPQNGPCDQSVIMSHVQNPTDTLVSHAYIFLLNG